MSPIENRPFDALQVGEEDRLVHTLTSEDFSLLATQAATIGSGLLDPMVAATRAVEIDAAQSGWASALMSSLIAGRLPGAGPKLVRQTIENTSAAESGDVLMIVATGSIQRRRDFLRSAKRSVLTTSPPSSHPRRS